MDVTKEDQVAEGYRKAVLEFGGIDAVVANAGIARAFPVETHPLDQWNLLHGILTTGYFLTAREAFRVWKNQGRGGNLVFIVSKNALVAGKNNLAYSSAKAAELHMARCLAEEGGAGIRVNTVNPDAVLTNSSIWTKEWRAERARLRHQSPTSWRSSEADTAQGPRVRRRTSPRRPTSSSRTGRPSPRGTSSTWTAASAAYPR
jgi:NAD(P)-dependent dehydrogenase (short-subunit alcohol dehydrogenase family)